MTKYIVCLAHTGYALDMIVATTNEAPELLPYEGEATCDQCDERAEYIVENKHSEHNM